MNPNLNTATMVEVQAIFRNTAVRYDDVILYGDEVLNNQHPGNQQFKLLIQNCIQRSLQKDHATIDNVAEAFWECHKPRKFLVWNRDSASYSELSKSYAFYVIKYALGEQEDLTLFETGWDWVNATADQGIINGDDEADAYLKCFPRDDHDGRESEPFPIDSSLDWENCRQHHLLDDLYDSDWTQANNQDDTVEGSSKRSRPTLEDSPRRGLPPDSRHHMVVAAEPTRACHIEPYPIGVPVDQEIRFSPADLDHLKNVLALPTESHDDLVQRLPAHNEQGQEHSSHAGLPPDIRHPVSDSVTEATDASHLAPFPIGVAHEQQFCFYREELDPSKNVLARSLPAHNEQGQEPASHAGVLPDSRHHLSDSVAEHTDASHLAPFPIGVAHEQQFCFYREELDPSKNVLARSLPAHNEQGQEPASHAGVLPDSRHHLSDSVAEHTDASHLAPFPIGVAHEQQFCFYREEVDPSKNVLARSLPTHNEQGQEPASHAGLLPDSRHHLSDSVTEPTNSSHRAPFPMGVPPKQPFCFSPEEHDLFNPFLAERQGLQDDLNHCLCNHNKQVQGAFHDTGLPPDDQMDSQTIVWFECSPNNTLNFRKDICAHQAECQLIAAESVLNHNVQAQGLLLILALLWIARNTFKKCSRESHLIDVVSLNKGRRQELRSIQMRSILVSSICQGLAKNATNRVASPAVLDPSTIDSIGEFYAPVTLPGLHL